MRAGLRRPPCPIGTSRGPEGHAQIRVRAGKLLGPVGMKERRSAANEREWTRMGNGLDCCSDRAAGSRAVRLVGTTDWAAEQCPSGWARGEHPLHGPAAGRDEDAGG